MNIENKFSLEHRNFLVHSIDERKQVDSMNIMTCIFFNLFSRQGHQETLYDHAKPKGNFDIKIFS